jgi:hypothetical protein
MPPLKPNPEVYMRSIKTLDRVWRLLPGSIHEPEELRFYEVQITTYIPRSDLELGDTGAVDKKRRSD